MGSISIIKKSILVVTALLVARDAAYAESKWSNSLKTTAVQSMGATRSEQRVNAAGTAVVAGTFYLTQTSCIGAADAFNTVLYVKQSGRRFTVQDSNGLRLRGRGSYRGFSVKARKFNFQSGIETTHSLSSGPVLSNYTANFRYTATLRRPLDGASCQSVFEGNLRVN
jgi:hypothetical protein